MLLFLYEMHVKFFSLELAPCSLGLSATSQQYFSLRTNQPPATSQNQPAVLFSQNKPAPAISHQPTEQAVDYRITFLSTGENDKVHKGRLRRKITYAK
jgi:hypothetical protein